MNDYENMFSDLCRLLPQVHANERKKIERFLDGINWEIRTRLSFMNFVIFHEILNTTLQVELELTEFRTIGEKKGRQDIPRMSGQINSESQGRPFQHCRFSQSQFSTPATSSRFSFVGSVHRMAILSGGSLGSFQARPGDGSYFRCGRSGVGGSTSAFTPMEPVRGGFQWNHGGQSRVCGTQGREVGGR
ncbi:hypothetical protein LIER_35795 [Lithospermum erythrorhizon]|uniref:Uncharacterized protein n=1 Tax=Lithospermum erythrorhizon TaxID=34254 RepID=A0AAV3NXY4_LITER